LRCWQYSQIGDVVNAQIWGYRQRIDLGKKAQNMTPAEYFDAAKNRLNIASDYELAKRLCIGANNMTYYRNGSRNIPLDAAFRLAITLELDPATVVADLESQREKNAKRRDFWTGFISRAAMVIGALACTLALSFSGGAGSALERPGGLSSGCLKRIISSLRKTYRFAI
jgi:hypothetical protein